MKELTCCCRSKWGPDVTDMGHFDSFEFMLGRCSNCGAYWMHLFCVAANSEGYERVTDNDARIMLTTSWGPELKTFMKAWFRVH
jgi:hypothetical protein